MSKNITIIDSQYKEWIADLSKRFRQSQVKAAVKVNTEMLRFYWSLGRDIVERQAENHYGKSFYANLSRDLKKAIPGVSGLTENNIRYAKRFYELYSQSQEILQQVAEKSDTPILQQVAESFTLRQLDAICSVPWGHHLLIIDKVKGDTAKALFYVRKTVENGWSRSVLLNWIETDLYEREGKAISNFKAMLPDEMSDLAQEITRDPYDFAFTGITGHYNERRLKDALLHNIVDFLIELGTGFAYVGKEYRLQIGEKEKFIDLLFYHLQLRCYVAVEVKTGDFDFPDMGQIGGYVVAVNHQLKRPEDNPTLGLLICKKKNVTLAQYALESSNQPIAISEYDLERFYPQKVEGMIPTIEEIESKLTDRLAAENEKNNEKQ